MYNKLFIFVQLFVLSSFTIYSQTPSYYHYTSADGLASSTVFDILQDQKGFIWFATLNGVNKFDGQNFITYRTSEGLNANSIISIAEGEKGELYLGSYEKGINVFKNDRIENYCNIIDGNSFHVSYLLLAPTKKNEQKLYAFRSTGYISVINKNENNELTSYNLNISPINVNKLERLPGNQILALTSTGLFDFRNDKLTKLKIEGLPDEFIYSLAKSNDGGYFIGMKGVIYKIKENKIISKYNVNLSGDNDVCTMLNDKNNNLWFSIMNKGFFLIRNGSDKIIDIGSMMDLQGTLINRYLEDREGNIWITTFGKGVYCLNNLYLNTFTEKDGLSSNNIYAIAKERSGKLLIGTFNGINLFENGKFEQIKNISKNTLTEYIHNIKNFENEFYICSAIGISLNLNISYRGIKLHISSQPSFCKTRDGLYLFGTEGNSIIVQQKFDYIKNEQYLIYLFEESANINRVSDIYEDSFKNIWAGTNLGLCKLSKISDENGEPKWNKLFFHTNRVLDSKILSIAEDKEKNVWFAGVNGVASYNFRNDSVTSYTTFMEYDLSSSTSIISDDRNRIWIGNMKGLFVFDGKSMKHLDRQNGLPSNEVYSLLYDNDVNYLYVGTSNGISFLDINQFDNYEYPPLDVKIINIKAGDSVYTNYSNLVFEPEQHNVNINFKALCFSSPGSIKYKYKLNDEWITTGYNILNFPSLKSGIYNLDIMAKSQNTDWGEPAFITFAIEPRFTETLWFYIGISALFVIISLSTVTWQLRLRNKKMIEGFEISERINELKHQALSAMMNPHFTFNALNSVQYLINFKRNEEANNYIAMMAKLIRRNLDTTGSGFILLSDEISRLKLYLDLEKLRFQENISYEIITGYDIDTESIMIPNMIIQPFVENSLWHGIINSGRKGILTVSFTYEDVDYDSVICKSLIIKITDNGIGINTAKKNKMEDHISKGIQIIEERLKLLSTKMQLPQPIMFEDLSSRDDNSHGTEVIISLPPTLYKISNS